MALIAHKPTALLLSLLGLLLLLPTLSGCHRPTPALSGPSTTRSFKIQGKVVGVNPATGEVTLDHQAVPGFMEAMVMPYKLAQPNLISELHTGDLITADLLADPIDKDPASGFRNVRLDHIVVVAQAKPDYKPALFYHVPTPGDQVPNFVLLNQSNKLIHLNDFKGRVLLMTFIYTRCALAGFCPRMSRNFSDIDRQLAADPRLYAATHLLSVSFDPAYDTPAVLRSYGGAYTGQYTRERFLHWDFAAPPVRDLQTMAQFFDVGVQSGEDRSISHSLSTVVIGKDGKVLDWYPTNDWNPADVVAEVKHAAAS